MPHGGKAGEESEDGARGTLGATKRVTGLTVGDRKATCSAYRCQQVAAREHIGGWKADWGAKWAVPPGCPIRPQHPPVSRPCLTLVSQMA